MVGALLSKELRKKYSFETSLLESLVVKGRSKEKREKSRGTSRSKSKDINSKVKCWYCNKIGHLKNDCWKRHKSKKDDYKSAENSVKSDSGMIDEVLFLCNISEYNKK